MERFESEDKEKTARNDDEAAGPLGKAADSPGPDLEQAEKGEGLHLQVPRGELERGVSEVVCDYRSRLQD